MAFKYVNLNPSQKIVGDCVVRAVAAATGENWQKTYIALALQGFLANDLMNSDSTWGAYLMNNGFERKVIPNTCPECYTIADFAMEHPTGIYVLGTGTHAVAVINGEYLDVWDSGNAIPIYYYEKV